MTAKEKFTQGQKVRMTEEAMRTIIPPPRRRRFGVVVGYNSRFSQWVNIAMDGRKQPESWHMDLWEAY